MINSYMRSERGLQPLNKMNLNGKKKGDFQFRPV